MRIPAALLAGMLGPDGRTVRAGFRCWCEAGRTRACVRAATEEDGLCDGCRAHRSGQPAAMDTLADAAVASLPYPLDVCWPAAHVSVFAYRPAFPG
jgi:hypothetical protein